MTIVKSDMLDKISVIIPVYNTAQYFEKCIDSIYNQSYNNIELIVVDDGSNRETKNKINEFLNKIDILIVQENKGQSTARNNGIKRANGEFILVLDSDDYFEPTFCEKAIKIFKNDNKIKIITCNSNIINHRNKKTNTFIPSGGELTQMILNNIAMGSCMIRKKDWQVSGGYDEEMRNGFEDWEFYIRLLLTGGTVAVIPEFLFNYRRGIESTTTRADKIKYDLLRYIYHKHENVYKIYFKDFIEFLLMKIEKEENEKLKMYSRLEYRLGFCILKPFRFVKRALECIKNHL